MCGFFARSNPNFRIYSGIIQEMLLNKETTVFDNDGLTHSISLIALLYSNSYGNLRIYVDKPDNFALANPYLNYLLRKAIDEKRIDIKIIIKGEVNNIENYHFLKELDVKFGIVLKIEDEEIKNFVTMDNESLRIEKSAETANGCFHDPLIVGKLNNLFMEHF